MANTTQHSIRVCTVTKTIAVFRERVICLEIITWTPPYSDYIVSKSLKNDKVSHSDIFCFQDIAYAFIQFYKILLHGLVDHCREPDEVCSPYNVESISSITHLSPHDVKTSIGYRIFRLLEGLI